MTRFVKHEHPLKHLSPITLTDDGMDRDVNELQLKKHALPISLTDDGIDRDVNE